MEFLKNAVWSWLGYANGRPLNAADIQRLFEAQRKQYRADLKEHQADVVHGLTAYMKAMNEDEKK